MVSKPALILWFFIGYWILKRAEFLFGPFFLPIPEISIWPSYQSGEGNIKGISLFVKILMSVLPIMH